MDKFEDLLKQCLIEGKEKHQKEDGSVEEYEKYNLRPRCSEIIVKIDELIPKNIDLQLIIEFLSEVNSFKECLFKKFCLEKLEIK